MHNEEATSSAQAEILKSVYTSVGADARFAQDQLLPPEAMILLRYHGSFADRRVLDIGVGRGRTTLYLAALTPRYVGIDYSETMIHACKLRFPEARIEKQDVRDLSAFGDGTFDSVFAPSAVLDALSHADRLRAVREIHRVLAKNGLFAFSGHNRDCRERSRPRLEFSKDPIRLAYNALLYGKHVYNWSRVRRFEYACDEYLIGNDSAFEWRALHYYISQRSQTLQLESLGFRVLECLSMNGVKVSDNTARHHNYKLHYVCNSS